MSAKDGVATVSRGVAVLTVPLDKFIDEVWDDEDGINHNTLVGLVAKQLAASLQKDIAKAVHEQIMAHVETIVRETLENPVQKMSAWGEPTGERSSLRDMIGKACDDALKKPELRDGYTRGQQPTMVQRIIANEVEKAFKAELQTHVKEAQKAAISAVKANAAEVISETIDRARRGLS